MKKTKGGSSTLIAILGITIAITGLYDMIQHGEYTRYEWMGMCFTNMLLFIGGLTIALFFRDNIRLSVSTTMVIIGIWGITNNIWFLDLSHTYLVQWIVSILSVISCILLIYFGVSLWLETSNGTMKGIIAIGILLFMILIPIIYEMHKGTPIPVVFSNNLHQIPMTIMFIVVIFILTNKEMMLPSVTSRITQNTIAITRSLSNEAEWYISHKELAILKNNDMKHWRHLDNAGPVEYERKMVLFGMKGSELLLQRWKGDDRVHLNVRPLFSDSSLVNISIIVNCIIEEKDEKGETFKIRIYGNDGKFMDFMVKDPNDEHVGYIGSRRRNKKIKDLNKYTKALSGRADRIHEEIVDDLLR